MPNASLLSDLPDNTPLTCWIRGGEGIVGFGEAYARTFSSSHDAQTWWADFTEHVVSDCECSLIGEPMAAPIAFISFPFAPDGDYELVVPSTVIGSWRGKSWVTHWEDTTDERHASDPYHQPHVVLHKGALDAEQWKSAVRQAVDAISAGDVEKVVLARDEMGIAFDPIDVRSLIAFLANAYPQTWTFCIKGLVGATPELLVKQDKGLVTSRVLAGTIFGDMDQSRMEDALTASSKDLAEHRYAVASVANALEPYVTSLHVPDMPFTLRLPNVIHLASDITGAAHQGTSILTLAEAIHPSAAVCGTPTETARQLIGELEHMNRGRYAGPVGWINSQGDGEIGIALRCAQIDGRDARLFAGAGIVADSDPDTEWRETEAKLAPMRQALGASSTLV